MAGLALKGILFGVDKIPDKWFEKIPYYQSEEAKQEKKRSKKDKSGRRRHSSTDRGYHSDDEPRHRHRERRRRSQDDYDSEDDYDGDRRRRADDLSHRRDSGRGHDIPANGAYPKSHSHRVHDLRGEAPQSPHSTRSGSLAGHNFAPPAVGVSGGMPGYGGYQENYPRPGSSGYPEYRRPSGPAQGYVPYAHIYSDREQAGYPQGRRSSQAYSPPGYDRGHGYPDQTPDYRGRQHGWDDYSSGSYGSDDPRRHGREPRPRARARSMANSRG